VQIEDDEYVPENFASVRRVAGLVVKLRARRA
jgi:hypothetical protein